MNNNNDLYSSGYGFFGRIAIMTIVSLFASFLFPGIQINNLLAALATVFVISLLDNLVRPVLIIVTLPINILSQGIFIFVINAFIVWLASAIVPGFYVNGFWSALLFSLILTFVDSLLQSKGIVNQRSAYIQKHQSKELTDDPDHFDDYEEIE